MIRIRRIQEDYTGISIVFQWFYIIVFPVISIHGTFPFLDRVMVSPYARLLFWGIVTLSIIWCVLCTYSNLFLRDKFKPSFNCEFDGVLLKSKGDAELALADVLDDDSGMIKSSSISFRSFQVKVNLLLGSLATVIEKTIPGLSTSDSDVFISVYFSENFCKKELFNGCLTYLAHYPSSKDVAFSRCIDILDEKNKGYECSQCLLDGDSLRVQLNPDKYIKANERAKTVKNYFGYPIRCRDDVVGFLNIEIHNRIIFKKEEEARDYAWKILNSHKILLEEFFINMCLYSNIHDRCDTCETR